MYARAARTSRGAATLGRLRSIAWAFLERPWNSSNASVASPLFVRNLTMDPPGCLKDATSYR